MEPSTEGVERGPLGTLARQPRQTTYTCMHIHAHACTHRKAMVDVVDVLPVVGNTRNLSDHSRVGEWGVTVTLASAAGGGAVTF